MSKQLLIYENDMPTVALFRAAAYKNAEKMGVEPRFKRLQEVTKEDLDWCDILEMIRPHDPYSVYLAKKASEAGRFVISYYDDDLYNLPPSMPNPFWRKNSVLNALRQSHMVVSSSRYICEKYRSDTRQKRSYAGDTIVETEEIKRITPLEHVENGEKVKLIYAAGPGHVAFFNRFILPVMPQLCERYAGKLSITFMGVHPDLAEFASQIDLTYYPTMPLDEYRQKIREGNYDIGLSPLTTDEFTKCKYFNKFIEYTIAGIVGVYSCTEPYTYVVRHGENGFLAKDTAEDWYQCLCNALDDALLRNRCVCAAQQQLLADFSPEALTEREISAIPELRTFCAQKPFAAPIAWQRTMHRLLVLPDRAYQLLFYLKRIGISGVAEKIKTHMRNAKAYS
ncbi:MAG: hypothetical protein E7446_06895 [Ruminococcaceae bacterium]|nr:hypothetical protein [Oscillospiraceae bacterium]